nr:MAG TPA: hypothetical protein [Caudoviricetes sp.]
MTLKVFTAFSGYTKFCRTRSKDIGHARRKYEPCNSRT